MLFVAKFYKYLLFGVVIMILVDYILENSTKYARFEDYILLYPALCFCLDRKCEQSRIMKLLCKALISLLAD